SIVGENGKIIGLDFTDIMIEKANKNVAKLGFKNISFIKGDIEQMPVESGSVDVVISNCVLNLVPDKQKAFSEIFRILKQDAHFCVSDVVIVGELPEHIRKSAELYAGCVSGAVQKNEYVDFIKKAGFKNVQIHKEKQVEIPDSTLEMIFSKEELIKFKESKVGIYSITVSAVK
ncbi:MAG: methyltransferase domain-containing protein, partial [Bacteroidales bacterium]|nr:methyltransferase domain-containing protein [Bacteroidales bacterium]